MGKDYVITVTRDDTEERVNFKVVDGIGELRSVGGPGNYNFETQFSLRCIAQEASMASSRSKTKASTGR